MRRRIGAVAVALALTLVFTGTVWAGDGTSEPAATGTPGNNLGQSVTAQGVLEYRDLEGGYWAVGEWKIDGDEALLRPYLGQTVTIVGYVVEEPSIHMVKTIRLATISGQSATEPETVTVEGVLERQVIETGFWSVGGWALRGVDEKLLTKLEGQWVIARGQQFAGQTTTMVKTLAVDLVARRIEAGAAQPAVVTVAGKRPAFDQGLAVVDGVLMVPLRAVVEAAGGKVEWVAAERAVVVTMPDRTAHFVIGRKEAEMNENGVYYFRQNLLPMAKAPVIIGDRTMISADALTQILGLVERLDLDGSMDLYSLK
ncbi:MAG: copper amine oxidase N-terminal domain-containing protein [Mycobacterium leprae]